MGGDESSHRACAFWGCSIYEGSAPGVGAGVRRSRASIGAEDTEGRRPKWEGGGRASSMRQLRKRSQQHGCPSNSKPRSGQSSLAATAAMEAAAAMAAAIVAAMMAVMVAAAANGGDGGGDCEDGGGEGHSTGDGSDGNSGDGGDSGGDCGGDSGDGGACADLGASLPCADLTASAPSRRVCSCGGSAGRLKQARSVRQPRSPPDVFWSTLEGLGCICPWHGQRTSRKSGAKVARKSSARIVWIVAKRRVCLFWRRLWRFRADVRPRFGLLGRGHTRTP